MARARIPILWPDALSQPVRVDCICCSMRAGFKGRYPARPPAGRGAPPALSSVNGPSQGGRPKSIRRSNMSMLDWNTYRQQLTVRIGEIAKLSPDTIKGYQALSAAGQKTNLLGPKIRELISLAVAEALGVATAVNAGAALVYSTRVLDAYEQVTAAA